MVIEVSCPECLREYRLSDDKAGKRFRCKECQNVVSVPSNEAEEWDDWGSYESDDNSGYDTYESDEEYENPYRSPKSSTRKKKSRSGKSKRLATVGSRIAAAAIDGLLYFVGYLIPIIFLIIVAPQEANDEEIGIMFIICLAVGILSVLGIQIFFLATRSQTIGKLMMSIRIDDFNTRRPAGLGSTVGMRMIVHQMIASIPLIGFVYSIADIVTLFSDENHRCLHDKLASTYVVDIS